MSLAELALWGSLAVIIAGWVIVAIWRIPRRSIGGHVDTREEFISCGACTVAIGAHSYDARCKLTRS